MNEHVFPIYIEKHLYFQKKPAATSEDRAWCRLLQMAPALSPSRRVLQKRRHFAGHTPGQSAETMPAEGSHW